MSNLRILAVDDRENWRKMLPDLLKQLGGDVIVDVADDYSPAVGYIQRHRYDLAVVDVALRDDASGSREPDKSGLVLLQDLRNSQINNGCGVLVLTAYPVTARTRQTYLDQDVYEVIDKSSFDAPTFVDVVRAAIFDALLQAGRG